MSEEAQNNQIPADEQQPAAEQTQENHTKTDSPNMSFKSILVGDILTHEFFRRQMVLMVMLVIYIIIYISNRYDCQQKLIEIDQLKKELVDIKYDALTRSSELLEKSRQSKIEEYVSQGESALETSTNPPYLIK